MSGNSCDEGEMEKAVAATNKISTIIFFIVCDLGFCEIGVSTS